MLLIDKLFLGVLGVLLVIKTKQIVHTGFVIKYRIRLIMSAEW